MPAETEGKVCFSHARFSIAWIFHKILKDFEIMTSDSFLQMAGTFAKRALDDI